MKGALYDDDILSGSSDALETGVADEPRLISGETKADVIESAMKIIVALRGDSTLMFGRVSVEQKY